MTKAHREVAPRDPKEREEDPIAREPYDVPLPAWRAYPDPQRVSRIQGPPR